MKGLLTIILIIILLPILLLTGVAIFLNNPTIGIVAIICITAIVIAKIIKE